jgi:spermidine synthase
LALFFISGACGLIYEIVWTRLLRLVMGNTVFSIATVLCAFMGGLAAGSYLGGKFIERRRDPLRIYAVLEAAVGIYCLLLPAIIGVAEPVYRLIYRHYDSSYYLFGLLRFTFCGTILLVPATFMGATLPVLSRFFAASLDRIGWAVGRLYAINTFGAFLGVAAAGFVLIPTLGVSRTIHLACLANLFVAGVAYLLYRRYPLPPQPPGGVGQDRHIRGRSETAVPAGGPGPMAARRRVVAWVLLVGYGLSGLAALTYEVAWTRVLSLIIGSSVYAFSLMLMAFILGLAIGSMALSWFVDRWRNVLAALAVTELAIGASALLVVPVFGVLPMYVGWMAAEFSESFWKLQLVEFALTFALMLIPTTLMGLAFPLVVRAYAIVTAGIGRSVGSIYAANTVGSILGSFLGGFVLIPLLGLRGTIFAAVAVNILVGCAWLLLSPSGQFPRRVAMASVAAVIVAVWAWALPAWDPATLNLGIYTVTRMGKGKTLQEVRRMTRGYKVLFHKEGIFDTITVREGGGERSLLINGKPDASTSVDMSTQQLLGHLPMFLHPKPDRVLVIGLASGVTLGACSLHPARQLDCVDISPDMAEATRFFNDVNHHVLEDPRVRLIIADGRNHLALTDREYDVIISEPSNPCVAGIADLFTVEFFRLCRQRLRDGGLVCIWVQGYSIDRQAFKSILRAFSDVFPHVTVWESLLPADYLLIGSQQPIVADCQEMERRLQEPSLREDVARMFMISPSELLANFVLSEKALTPLLAATPIHTDDNGLVEYSTPRTMFSGASTSPLMEELNRWRGTGLEDLLVRAADQDQVKEITAHAARLMEARRHLVNAMIANRRKQGLEALAEYKAAAEIDPNHPILRTVVGDLLTLSKEEEAQKRPDKAAALLQKILDIMPDHPEAHYRLAQLLYSQRQLRRAVEHFERAMAAKPDWAELMNNLAWILATSPDPTLRDGAKAVQLAERAVQLAPAVETFDTLAVALAEAGQFDRAVSTARRAADLARKAGQMDLVRQIEARIALYQAGKPYRENF